MNQTGVDFMRVAVVRPGKLPHHRGGCYACADDDLRCICFDGCSASADICIVALLYACLASLSSIAAVALSSMLLSLLPHRHLLPAACKYLACT